MRLNKSTNDAIRILCACAQADGALTKVADLADTLDLTHQNTFKIVHVLTNAGFLTSVRGRHGGVRLSGRPAEISIGDVVREIEAGLGGKASAPKSNKHKFDALLDDAFAAFLQVLDRQTLADIASAKHLAKRPEKKARAGRRTSQLKKPRSAAVRRQLQSGL